MTCAKKRVICTIRDIDGNYVVGENKCDNPQTACPRLPGEGYKKCKSMCRQEGHAEIMALKKAIDAGFLQLAGATATIRGIAYCCKDCALALKEAGVKAIIIMLWDAK